MNSTENQKKAWIALVIVVIVVLGAVWFMRSKPAPVPQPTVDTRESECSKKTIESIEFDAVKMACFSTKISACQTPTYTTLEACQKENPTK